MTPLFTPYLHKKRIEIVKPYLKGDILDIGCSSATLIRYLHENQHYAGIDVDKRIIKKLIKDYPYYDFYCCNVEKYIPPLNRKFDTIFMIAVVEHLKNPENILQRCCTLLKDNGALIITTPTPFGGMIHKIGAKLGLASKDAAKEHHYLYSYEDMKCLLASNGFRISISKKFELGGNQMFECKKDLY